MDFITRFEDTYGLDKRLYRNVLPKGSVRNMTARKYSNNTVVDGLLQSKIRLDALSNPRNQTASKFSLNQ